MIAPERIYPTEHERFIVLVDIRFPNAEGLLRRELADWRGFMDADDLYLGMAALVIRPRGAVRLPR